MIFLHALSEWVPDWPRSPQCQTVSESPAALRTSPTHPVAEGISSSRPWICKTSTIDSVSLSLCTLAVPSVTSRFTLRFNGRNNWGAVTLAKFRCEARCNYDAWPKMMTWWCNATGNTGPATQHSTPRYFSTRAAACRTCRGLSWCTQRGRLLRRGGTRPLGSKGYRPRSCPGVSRDWIEAFMCTNISEENSEVNLPTIWTHV